MTIRFEVGSDLEGDGCLYVTIQEDGESRYATDTELVDLAEYLNTRRKIKLPPAKG